MTSAPASQPACVSRTSWLEPSVKPMAMHSQQGMYGYRTIKPYTMCIYIYTYNVRRPQDAADYRWANGLPDPGKGGGGGGRYGRYGGKGAKGGRGTKGAVDGKNGHRGGWMEKCFQLANAINGSDCCMCVNIRKLVSRQCFNNLSRHCFSTCHYNASSHVTTIFHHTIASAGVGRRDAPRMAVPRAA